MLSAPTATAQIFYINLMARQSFGSIWLTQKNLSCHSWSVYLVLSSLQATSCFILSRTLSARSAASFCLRDKKTEMTQRYEIICLVSHHWHVFQLRLKPTRVDPKPLPCTHKIKLFGSLLISYFNLSPTLFRYLLYFRYYTSCQV